MRWAKPTERMLAEYVLCLHVKKVTKQNPKSSNYQYVVNMWGSDGRHEEDMSGTNFAAFVLTPIKLPQYRLLRTIWKANERTKKKSS